jgi:hypothetical protein
MMPIHRHASSAGRGHPQAISGGLPHYEDPGTSGQCVADPARTACKCLAIRLTDCLRAGSGRSGTPSTRWGEDASYLP